MAWEKLREDLWRLRDSCVVYAVAGPAGTVLVNAGTGLAAATLAELPAPKPWTVLLTHHFRDHCEGAAVLAQAGAEILAPYWEQEYLLDPEQHFRERQTWNSYDNRWDRFSPLAALPISGWLMDYERRSIAGLEWEVLPTPAQSCGAIALLVTHHGQRLAFTGELISGPGRTGRLAPLQYNYNDYTGVHNLFHSCRRLLAAAPDQLLPSIGEPIAEPRPALELLRANLKLLDGVQPGLGADLRDPAADELEEIVPGLYRSKYAVAHTHFLAKDGRVLALDYGYASHEYLPPGKSHLGNRRPILHGLAGLQARGLPARVDTVLLSHYHDDHLNGVPLLQRLFGTACWAGEPFADLLENPLRYDRPCLWHEPIPVARRLPCGERFEWQGIPFWLHPMSGHTRFSTLILFEFQGQRFAHTGDQIFFRGDQGIGYGPGARLFTNHVYKNGLDLGCYHETLRHLRAFRPDWVLSGHALPYRTDERWYEVIREGAEAFDQAHRALMPLGDSETHFGPESQAAKLKPYRLHRARGPFEVYGWVLNPFPHAATAELRLVLPEGWQAPTLKLALEPRAQGEFRLPVKVPPMTRCRRQPIGLALTVDGQHFGQVAEALVTLGLPRW